MVKLKRFTGGSWVCDEFNDGFENVGRFEGNLTADISDFVW